MLRGQVADIMIGSVFLFVGLAACSIAAIRRWSAARIFVWLGIWSAMHVAVLPIESPAVLEVLPRWLQINDPQRVIETLDTAGRSSAPPATDRDSHSL